MRSYAGRMLGRLLLALLLATFAVPAATMGPACHDAPMAMTHHDAPAAPKKATAHLCIGCAAVADWLGERVGEPVPIAAARPMARNERLDLAGSDPPALPPPRAA